MTVGVFDGVHLGHRFLIDTLKERAAGRDLLSVALTFECHPMEVLKPACPLPWLTTVEERLDLIRSLGVGMALALPFNSAVAAMPARDFLVALRQNLRMKGVVAGPDFALGRGREGSPEVLRSLGREMGFTVEHVPPLIVDGIAVSSTAVRQAVARGDVRLFFKLVGRYYALRGEVIRGAERGRSLGFPTANLAVEPLRATPADGVYATFAIFEGRRYPSVTNIGTRPTFEDGARLAETYILGYRGDLYGNELRIELVERLRDERRFSSVAGLVEQMNKDAQRARSVLEVEAKLVAGRR